MTQPADQVQRAQAHLPRGAGTTAKRIIEEAERAGILWRDGLALVEGESSFRNVFGHDRGGMFPGRRVRRPLVWLLIRAVRRGHVSNGVGVTQLTSLGFILEARRRGGAYKPRHQLSVAYDLLADLQRKHGRHNGFAAYNGGEGGMHDTAPQAYARSMMVRAERWINVLKGAA